MRANEEKGEGGEVKVETGIEFGENENQSRDKRERKKTNKILNA